MQGLGFGVKDLRFRVEGSRSSLALDAISQTRGNVQLWFGILHAFQATLH